MRRIVEYKEAVELIQSRSYLFLLKNKLDEKSLESMSCSSAWYTNTNLDPWRWKGRIAAEKKAAYTKLFCKKNMFISWNWYPYYLAYFRKGKDADNFYKSGELSRCAKDIYGILVETNELPSHEIKRLLNTNYEKGKFENALVELQCKMLITVCGEARKINKNGDPYGWHSSKFALVDNWVEPEILQEADKISFEEARVVLQEQIRKENPSASEKDISRLLKRI